MLRHADDITLNHLIELRKLTVDVEALREENERLREALTKIEWFSRERHIGEIARVALKESE